MKTEENKSVSVMAAYSFEEEDDFYFLDLESINKNHALLQHIILN
ncbi:MAG TPA: hypothetical protein PK252_12555 [Bacteroidales bacterium]|nr:hypothetical protein [Bacteroidales bacterium]